MVSSLSISDLAIIEKLHIDFSAGFNVITGETGAGKSILIRALHFLMGGKTSAETIRSGSEQAVVCGEFQVGSTHPLLISLANLGIPYETEGDRVTLLIRRLVSLKGRSQAFINDVAVTTTALREIGTQLVDVFGQHENQRLMDSAHHLKYVDDFLADKSLVSMAQAKIASVWASVRALQAEIESYQDLGKDQDYLTYRLEELEKFSPSVEDYEETRRLASIAGRVFDSQEAFRKAMVLLEDDAGEVNLSRNLKEALRVIEALSRKTPDDRDLGPIAEKLQSLQEGVGEVSYELSRKLSELDIDESDLDKAQSRDFAYQEIFRKFSVKSVESLLAEKVQIEARLSGTAGFAERLEGLLSDLAIEVAEAHRLASELASARRRASEKIQKQVKRELQELSMPGCRLEIAWEAVHRALPVVEFSALGEKAAAGLQKAWQKICPQLGQLGDCGLERASMLLSSNPGEPALPLAKIASGGELSRILLAFKRALAVDAETCVLVFDEIDTGISGRVADVVGLKLKDLATKFQVLCISHLAQVAVYADTHFLVQKAGKGARTQSTIVSLSAQESAKEIARLLSGSELSTPSLANAKNLIAKAREKSGAAATRT